MQLIVENGSQDSTSSTSPKIATKTLWEQSRRGLFMKNFILLIAAGIMIISVGSQAYGADKILTPAEVTSLFSDKTMTAVSLGHKDKNREKPFKVFTSGMGAVRTMSETGAVDSRSWSVTEKGQICFSSSFKNRKGGATCGYLVTDGGGTYRMYDSKKLQSRGGKVGGAKKKDLKLIFSQFVSGNSLEQ